MRVVVHHCKKCHRPLGVFENNYCHKCEKTVFNKIGLGLDYVNACVKIKVPKWQIGQEVSVYFKDTMWIKGICEEAE